MFNWIPYSLKEMEFEIKTSKKIKSDVATMRSEIKGVSVDRNCIDISDSIKTS